MSEHPATPAIDQILLGDNLELLTGFPDESFQLVYIDPPFNTGKVQERKTLRAVRDGEGAHRGFQGTRYSVELLARHSYSDEF
ncbi:MAG TPA: hypothetical protein VGN25_10825, partial [Solirubrobacteraceae bacterium]|nr:hypothetical protein [Solirubrobacteraceae bacterium]